MANLDPWWYCLLETVTPTQARSTALRDILEMLKRGGRTHHSARGRTLAYLVTRLEQLKIPYTIEALPGRGYRIESHPGREEFP